MSTRTFHISFPAAWAKKIESEIRNGHYSISEYFKELYRCAIRHREYADFQDSLKSYQKEKKSGKLKNLTSIDELFE